MAALPTSRTVTYEEWLRMPEVSEAIEEVVNGEIRIMPPPKWQHALIVQRLSDALRAQLDNRMVLVMTTQFGLIVREAPLTSRVPDIAVFELSTVVEQDGYIRSAPQLVVEVRSAANTPQERDEKLADYAALGVPEVWAVSPQSRTVEVFYLEDARLRRAAILAEGVMKPRHFAHVEIDIAAIWPD